MFSEQVLRRLFLAPGGHTGIMSRWNRVCNSEEMVLSLLALLNPSKAFLAMSAVLAGYCLFRFYNNTAGNLLVVPYLLAAGALLAMADSAWRLLFTAAAERGDEIETPARGMLSTTASFFLAVFTTLSGLMCAMTGGYNTFRAAGVMLILMLARSALFRRTEIVSPLLGGLIWGLLFFIGVTAHSAFVEVLLTSEMRIPAAFFTAYAIVASVLSQVRDSAKPREAPAGEELSSETASRLLEMRGDAIDSFVVWFAGGALVLMPLVLAWVQPLQWLSVAILVFLSLSIVSKLVPVLVYRTRKDLETFIEAVYRGMALLSAGGVASLGHYQLRELYEGRMISMPGRDQLAAVAIIALLAAPAWLLRRVAPVD